MLSGLILVEQPFVGLVRVLVEDKWEASLKLQAQSSKSRKPHLDPAFGSLRFPFKTKERVPSKTETHTPKSQDRICHRNPCRRDARQVGPPWTSSAPWGPWAHGSPAGTSARERAMGTLNPCYSETGGHRCPFWLFW